MKNRNLLLLLPGLMLLARFSFGANTEPVRENIEWCDVWMPHINEKAMPRVLLIGDSITRAYYPEVDKQLLGKAYVARLCTSKSIGDPALISELTAFISQSHFDVIHFNNGMHGWGYSEDAYRNAFPSVLEVIQKAAPGAKLIWASTTPVRLDKDKGPNNTRIQTRNAIAAEYANQNKMAVDDLYALMENRPELHSDDVHFGKEGQALQAAQVAASVLKVLSAK